MPILTLKFEDEALKTYRIDEPVVTVGRLPENTISIVNMGVSRRHARMEIEPDGSYTITDLNSLNGTYVNDKRVTKTVLSFGDKIIIGKYTILFDKGSSDPGAPPAPPARKPTAATASSTSDTLHVTTTQAPSAAAHAQDKGEDDAKGAALGCPVLIETNKHVVYKIEKDLLTLGNSEGDDIFIDGLFIDEAHVCIERRPDGLWLTSKKLFGKVKVNGKKTKDHMLEHKDRIEIGSSTLRYMQNG